MASSVKGVVLVGHGGIPKDCPQDLVTKLKRLESQRRRAGLPPGAEELELDAKIRQWPRTSETDPYQTGLEKVAIELRRSLNGTLFGIAYNEFCAPTLEDAVEDLIRQGATQVTVITTMFTPGGSHSEIEIPEILDQLRPKHPGIDLRYAWPFDLQTVARTLADQLQRFA
ncbi:MAG: CbiX/SirB N-terminal domain-containing protein [Nitrospiraceae bacterium]